MNGRKFLISLVVVFVWIFAFDWLFHTQLMSGIYHKTASLWRPEAHMKDYFCWLIGGEFLLAFIFCLLLSRAPVGLNAFKGTKFGVFMALFLSGSWLISYAVQPFPLNMVGYWILGAVIEFGIAGAIAASILKEEEIV